MYAAGGGAANSIVDEDKEAYLLGKKRVDRLVEQGSSTQELAASNVFSKTNTSFYGVSANTAKDLQTKVREDPLLAIR